mgnify:CR=1 FL=1
MLLVLINRADLLLTLIGMKVNFQKLKSLFDSEEWDVGILSDEYYDECMNSPIKAVSHPYGVDMSQNPISSYITASVSYTHLTLPTKA